MTNEQSEITAFPLAWPNGKPRTERQKREHSRFKTTVDRARRELIDEIQRLGGKRPIISTNQKLRLDGYPYAGMREPDDNGVAVYFMLDDKSRVFACDRYRSMADNLRAITLTIEALRGISRWGTGDMMNQAFSGFVALPPGKSEAVQAGWREVLGFGSLKASIYDVKARRNELARKYHPDIGSHPDAAQMAAVNKAFTQASEELGGPSAR